MLAGCTPWPAEDAARWRRLGLWEDITLWQMLEHTARRVPERIALVHGERRIAYGELLERSELLARRLVAAGLRPLDRVVMQLPNTPEFVFTFFALVRIGVIPVMALPAHRHNELGHFIRHAGARALFVPERVRDFDYRPMADELRTECPTLEQVFVAGAPLPGQSPLADLLDDASPAARAAALPEVAADEVALMLLSGGTTALPKLIPRTHNDYVLNAKAAGRVAQVDESTVFLAVLPLGHNYSLASPGILACFAVGATVVLAPGHAAETVFPLIERHRVTLVSAAVPLVTLWLNSEVPARHDLSSLKVVQNGGARLAPELRRRVRTQWGCIPQEDYGTAEGLINLVRLDAPEDLLLESSGSPVCEYDEIKVVDLEGDEVPDGEPGELLARGPYTIRGYYNAPETNAAAFTADGFYRMGDVVRKVGRYLFTEGRKKDLINRGGEKISSDEVENLILMHPAVEGCCVVAMPDPIYGEKACAFVVLHEGSALALPELCEFLLAQRIAKFKLPERLEVVERFPISPAGKILRRELRERIAATVAREGGGPGAQYRG
ncbi:MAG: AMP-binding protein [Burkholderiales bacterium]|nr:AMP-binding protein [Burkholderiales bacterium]OJX07515.1 MAG: 2,3-dihydroxybenzoate-AMP ligase [Burkholderiales bacterium 70-64]